jgi:hypothetical protein
MAGASLDAMAIIDLYNKARKLAPPRFLTIRVHPDTWKHVESESEPTHVIQYGDTPGPLGKKILRLACVKPPSGIADGISIVMDPKVDVGEIILEIHGIPEQVYRNYGITTKSS